MPPSNFCFQAIASVMKSGLFPSLAVHRKQFPALVEKVYLNFGGQGPLARPAREAIALAYDRFEQLGPFSKAAWSWLMPEEDSLRQAIARLLNTTPDRIALTESTIAGMNVPLWGLDWQAGDRLLLSDAEHYAVWEIARGLRDRFGIELDTCPLSESQATQSHPGQSRTNEIDNFVRTLESCLHPKTRMVCISHVFWNSGTILPLKELAECCHQQGILLHVDAAQSAGVLPLDLPDLGVDFYAFTGHKWLCGPAGVGALYISERGQAAIQPTFTGWCKTYAKGGAETFEVSTAAYPLRVGLRAALELHERFGSTRDRYQKQVRTSQYLWRKLQEIPGVKVCNSQLPQTGLVPFCIVDRDPQDLELLLEDQRIYVRSMQSPPCLRASVHYFTTEEELDRLLEALKTLMQ